MIHAHDMVLADNLWTFKLSLVCYEICIKWGISLFCLGIEDFCFGTEIVS